MDGGAHAEGQLNRQREVPQTTVLELRSVSEVKEAKLKLGSNLLNERTFVEKLSGSQDTWLEGLQLNLDNKEVFAFEIQEGATSIGFVLADRNGAIMQLRCPDPEKVGTVIEQALLTLKDKGIQSPTVRFKEDSEQGEHLHHALQERGFEVHKGEGGEEDGKIEMRKV